MRRSWVLLAVVTALGCGIRRRDEGGVTVEEEPRSARISAEGLSVVLGAPKPAGDEQLVLTPWAARGPIAFEVAIDGVQRRVVAREVVTIDGAAALRLLLEGSSGELLVTIDRTIPSLVVRARTAHLEPSARISLRVSAARGVDDVILDRGAPYGPAEQRPASRSGYVVAVGASPLVIASPERLDVEGGVALAATASAEALASGGAEARIVVASLSTVGESLAVGARVAGVAPRSRADVRIVVRDALLGFPVPARVWLEPFPRISPKSPIVFDETRDAERTTPIVDVTAPRTTLSLPEGRYVMRATRGMGWSVARKEIELAATDATSVSLELREEASPSGFIGCDFHVHARPSFDATAVSYEERVRSLVAVGVECAAATEHDHVGDHGPAASALGLDGRFRALTGVELTTVAPAFGHFNVYPWPAAANLPKTKATAPHALFDAVHALPGSFVFQLNHPRMRNADGTSIGYLDVALVDRETGAAKSPHYAYRRDYDAIEIFNGYELAALGPVRALTEEWLRMLDRGEVHVATGSSDSHGISFPWAGFPRTMVFVGASWWHDGRPVAAIVDALKRGRAYVTSGPLLDLRIGQATLGETTHGPSIVRLAIARSTWLGPPSVSFRLGREVIPGVVVRADGGGGFVAEATVPKTTNKRPLVAIVEADVIGDALGLTGFPRAMALTNPIWIEP